MIAHVAAGLTGSTVVVATNGRIRWPETVMRTAATIAECSGGKWYTSIPEAYACLARQLQEQDLPGEGQVYDLLRQNEELYGDVQDAGEGHFLWLVHPSAFWSSPLLCPQCHTERSAHSACPGQPCGEPCRRPACAASAPLCCRCRQSEAASSQNASPAASFVPLVDAAILPKLLPDLLAIKDRELGELQLEAQVLDKLQRFVEEHDLSACSDSRKRNCALPTRSSSGSACSNRSASKGDTPNWRCRSRRCWNCNGSSRNRPKRGKRKGGRRELQEKDHGALSFQQACLLLEGKRQVHRSIPVQRRGGL